MRMRVCYLDCHEAGLCCYLVIHIENLLRPLQLFYFHLCPICWLSLLNLKVIITEWKLFSLTDKAIHVKFLRKIFYIKSLYKIFYIKSSFSVYRATLFCLNFTILHYTHYTRYMFRPHGPSSGVLIVVAKTVIMLSFVLLKFIRKSFLRHDSYAPYHACSLFFAPGSLIPVPGAAVCNTRAHITTVFYSYPVSL
jgi:hypothetical protein